MRKQKEMDSLKRWNICFETRNKDITRREREKERIFKIIFLDLRLHKHQLEVKRRHYYKTMSSK